MDDLEARLVETLALCQVPGEPRRDCDVHVCEPGDGAVRRGERPPVTKRVEAVLRRDQRRNTCQPAGGEAVKVGVDEVRVQDRRALAADDPREPREGRRVGRVREAHALDRDPRLLEPRREVRRARLVLVEHREPDVEAALAERGEEQQEMILGPRDPRDLRDVKDAKTHG